MGRHVAVKMAISEGRGGGQEGTIGRGVNYK